MKASTVQLQARPSARLLVIDPRNRMLLFRFAHRGGALDGQVYWATPGGALEAGESFTEAALRELQEETGIAMTQLGLQIDEREFVLQMPEGHYVLSQERFYAVRVDHCTVSRDGWTAQEHAMMAEHRWWSMEELHAAAETVFPPDLADMLERALTLA